MDKPEIRRLLNKYARRTETFRSPSTAAAAAASAAPAPAALRRKDEGTGIKPVPMPIPQAPPPELPAPPPQPLGAIPQLSNSNGRYTNWGSQHAALAAEAWCCIGQVMAFCDKYEYRVLSVRDCEAHGRIVGEVHELLSGHAPFDMRVRFPALGDGVGDLEKLWLCVGRCAGVEYHLNRILSVFRRPLDKLAADKQRAAKQNFRLALNELRLDISGRISQLRLYERNLFEREFHLNWQDTREHSATPTPTAVLT